MERQKRYEVALLIIYLVAALVVGTNAEGDSCRMEQRYPGEMVNIAQAKENAKQDNGIVTVPKGSTVNSSLQCEQGCCSYDNCTVYLFYPRPPTLGEDKKFNCFYLNCRPQELCSKAFVNVSDKAEGSVVGIRDLQQDNAVILQADGKALKDVSTEKPASEVISASTDQSHADVSSVKTSVTPLPKTTAYSTEMKETFNVTMKVGIEASGTSLPKKLERELYGDNHTTYPSLVIALGFGLLFLCAAVVLIGRPWWFAFHRPRYSKVDYLMNGL